jgi:hypothetical protein
VKARRLIESPTFEPETLEVIYKAFDAAWVARGDSRDAERLKDDAVQVMALANRDRSERD